MSEDEIKQMRQRAELAAEITLPGANFRALLDQFQTLRDERDRLLAIIKDLQPKVSHVIARCRSCGDYTDDIEWHYKPIIDPQAALTPAKGVQHHPAFDEYGEHRQPTGLGDL